MTQISLRAYIREIDNLIERELLDEAIAHCRHILQTYPKHVETYRLLGKSYLEAKRYGDAADIFQRVLSAVPDDFVSHIGMAIVREDEGNLDSAIWHMERAFETNPANPAIQQELRRLIGRRDGFEPNKVRLTRGALARMYAQGELYPQAIAELQSALQEDQERPDLQVLLAEMLWQTDQKMEAADVSRQILEKLPFCQKAARIMAAVHQEQGKSEEGTAYHRRLAQLDPYAAYVEYPMVDTVKVEADTIRVERLDWRPGQPLPASESAQPDWAESLGVEIEGDPDDIDTGGPLPSWLDDIEPAADSLEIDDGEPETSTQASPFETPPSLEDEEPEAPEAEEEDAEGEIPDWMSDAGWEESSGEAVETPVSFSESELSALERGELPMEEDSGSESDEELAPAEIPSWLQERAPSPSESQPQAGGQEVGETPSGTEQIAEPESSPSEADAEARDLTPDWLGEMASEAATDEMSAELPSFDFAEQDEPVDASEATTEPGDQGEIPGWLDDSEPGATSTILTWLGNREDVEEGQEADAEAEQEAVPDWMDAAVGDADEDQTFPISPTEDEPAGGAPDWMGAALEEADEDETIPSLPTEGEPAEAPPAWMQAAMEDAGEDETIPSLPTGDEPVEAPPAWMQAAMEDAGEDETIPSLPPEDEPAEAPPAWLSGLAQAAAESDEAELDELAQLRAESEASTEDSLDAEEAEAEPGEIPGWLMAIRGDEGAEEAIAAEDFEAELPESFPWESEELDQEEPVPESSMDFDEELTAEGTVPTASAETSLASELPTADETDAASWLKNLSEDSEDTLAPRLEPADEAGPDSATSWLENLGQPDEDEPVARTEPSADEPEWMRGLEDEDTDDEAMGDLASTWLEGLAETLAETPAEPDEASVEPGADSDDVPTWLLDYESPQTEVDLPDFESELSPGQPTEPESPAPTPADEESDRLQLLEELGLQESETSTETVAPTEGAAGEAYDLGQLDGMDDDQIFDWLEGLAARDEDETAKEEEPGAFGSMTEMAAADTAEAGAAPTEDAEADLGWLEQLAEQRGISSDVQARPSPASSAPRPAEDEQPEPEPGLPVEHPTRSMAHEAAPMEPEEAQQPPAPVETGPAEEPVVEEQEVEPEETTAAEPPDWLIAAQEQAGAESPAPATQMAHPDEAQAPPPVEAEPEQEPAAAREFAAEAPAQPDSMIPTDSEPEEEPEAEAAPESALPPATVTAPTVEEPSAAPDSDLARAREALETGNVDRAADEYGQLIKARRSLPNVVEDLEAALDRDPESSKLWQLLGDAYMKADRTSDAVKAYNRGMKEAEVLNSARQALASGDQQRAAAQYGILIKRKKKLDDVIQDLENAVAQADDQPAIWQVLGDAYMKADRLDESIEAYRKGMSSV